MYQRKLICENRWLILNGTKPFAFLSKEKDYTITIEDSTFKFNTYEDLQEAIGKIVDVVIKEDKQIQIQGYATRHKNAKDVNHKTLPVYNVGSKTIFCAGYYTLKFENSDLWQTVFGPKLATLESYNFEGPFYTDLEAKYAAKMLNDKS